MAMGISSAQTVVVLATILTEHVISVVDQESTLMVVNAEHVEEVDAMLLHVNVVEVTAELNAQNVMEKAKLIVIIVMDLANVLVAMEMEGGRVSLVIQLGHVVSAKAKV